MSTVYITKPPIPFVCLEGRLPSELSIKPHKPAYSVACFCLTDGTSYLWANRDEQGNTQFERFGANRVVPILRILEGTFDVKAYDQMTDLPIDEEVD